MSRDVANYKLTARHIKTALTRLAERDARIAKAIARVGMPNARRSPHGFEALARIVVGQQVSTKAAEAINGRLVDALSGNLGPDTVARADESLLRGAGLSRQKVSYLKSLSAAVATGEPSATLGCWASRRHAPRLPICSTIASTR